MSNPLSLRYMEDVQELLLITSKWKIKEKVNILSIATNRVTTLSFYFFYKIIIKKTNQT